MNDDDDDDDDDDDACAMIHWCFEKCFYCFVPTWQWQHPHKFLGEEAFWDTLIWNVMGFQSA